MLVLRQKLQSSRNARETSNDGSTSYGSGATAILESELRRVQVLVADMQRQRQDLSFAVRQLTDNSNSLYHQLRQRSDTKCPWSETDIDLENIEREKIINFDTYSKKDRDISHDSNNQSFSNSILQDKQEIKTVRIVKREAEKRQRDREKTDKSIQHLDDVLKEEFNVLQEYNQNRLRSQSREFGLNDVKSFNSTNPFKVTKSSERAIDLYENQDDSYLVSFTDSEKHRSDNSVKSQRGNVDSSVVYQSEAAKQIITEMSSNVDCTTGTQKRLIPKEKKRHNTAPHHINSQFIDMMQLTNEANKTVSNHIFPCLVY